MKIKHSLKSFGRNVAALREAQGMIQEELAAAINKRHTISRGYLAQLETGTYKKDPKLSLAVAIAEALGVGIGELLK